MDEWVTKKLGEVVEIKHGFAFSGSGITDEKTDHILVTPGNFHIGGGFKSTKLKYFRGDYPEAYRLKPGDVVVTMTDLSQETDTLGYAAKIPQNSTCHFLHNQRIGLLQFKRDDVSQDFIYWLMRTSEYQNFVVSTASGTAIMHTSPKRIGEYTFSLPPLQEQKAIAEVLNSLDDKIDLIHRNNRTLQLMAEALFKRFFWLESEDTWESVSALECFRLVGGGTPATSNPSFWDGHIKWMSAKDITEAHKGFILTTEKTITDLGLQNSSTKMLPKFATVISARGTVGKFCLLAEPMCFSQSNYGILPVDDECYFFTHLLVASLVKELQAASYGTVFDTITTRTFADLTVNLPPHDLIKKFDKRVAPLFEKMLLNSQQIDSISKLRDSLLPKLMSGDIVVSTELKLQHES